MVASFLFSVVAVVFYDVVVFAKSPDGPSQQCADDAGPPWQDDDVVPWAASPALPVTDTFGQCPKPLQGACQSKDLKRAFLEGPVDCGGRGWFCRIAPQEGWKNPFYNDRNFAHCNTTDADERDNDGHCHGSDVDNVYGWWVRDHWFRGYAGSLHCCCDWNGLKGLVNRCDYRKYVSPTVLETCRDANEEHQKGYDGSCEAHSSIPFEEPVGKSDQCWTVYNFADPESVPNPSPIVGAPKPTNAPPPPPPPSSSGGGFDWGEGCVAGNGKFELELPNAGESADVGVIPKGKFNIRIDLTAANDLDITLYDMEETSKYPEGQAIVQWCKGDCNIGVLGTNSRYSEEVYVRSGITPMLIKYSGFNGVNNLRGNEFIEIEGEVSTPLMMKAFAYESGNAVVKYSWTRSQSPCCTGTGKCGGSFSQFVQKEALVTVGEIPKGKKDVYISLSSEKDVDIQIYDLDDTSKYAEGQAIVAWCVTPCNIGLLNEASERTEVYPGIGNNAIDRPYTYSGFSGVNNQLGNEFIRITGTSTRRLVMKVYGYDSGSAIVRYEYMESFDS